MPHANRPAGPGRATTEQRDAAVEREELEQMDEEAAGAADAPPRDPSRSVRQAARDAHAHDTSRNADRAPGRRRTGR